MRRRIAIIAAALGIAALPGCYAFPHSTQTLQICVSAPGQWSSAACGNALCRDYLNFQGPGYVCPLSVRYGTGPR